jgi:hypothetical protein
MNETMNRRGLVAVAVLTMFLLASGVGSPAAMAVEDNELVDRWEFDLGGFFLGSSTDVTLYSTLLGQGTEVSLEDDLGFDSSDFSFHAKAAYLIGRRHQVSLGYYKLNRDSSQQIDFELDWGDETFPLSATVIGYFDTTFLEFGYDFWLVTRERTALSLGLSLTYLSVEAGLGIDGVDVGDVSGDLKTDVPVPAVFVSLRQHLVQRLILRAKLGYMTLNPIPDYKGDLWNGYIALEHRTWKNVGFGLKYSRDSYNIQKEDGAILDWDIGFDLSGFEFYLHFMF